MKKKKEKFEKEAARIEREKLELERKAIEKRDQELKDKENEADEVHNKEQLKKLLQIEAHKEALRIEVEMKERETK